MSIEHLVSPGGIVQFARWCCSGTCPVISASTLEGDEAREQAAAHVRETGHTVRVERGTRELLQPMAVAPQ